MTYHLTGVVHSIDVDFLIDGVFVTKVTTSDMYTAYTFSNRSTLLFGGLVTLSYTHCHQRNPLLE